MNTQRRVPSKDDRVSIDAFPTDMLADEPSWTLIIADHAGRPMRQISLLERTKLTVGRSTTRDLILDDAKVSRLHCILYLERGVWCVVDAESAGGTYVEGQRVLWKRLHDQRAVQIGDTKMWIRQSPLPTIDPALNLPQSATDNTESEADPHSDPAPGDTIFWVDQWDDDAPLPLDPDAPTPLEAAPDAGDEDAALDRTSVFLREDDDFVDTSPLSPRVSADGHHTDSQGPDDSF